MNRKQLYDLLMAEYILCLVIGEDIPKDAPSEFHIVKLYLRDKNQNLKLYADIHLPNLFNHSEFVNITEDDPKYVFKEGFEPQTNECKDICEIKPFGDMKGIYRIHNGECIKIQSIKPLCELEMNMKPHTLIKK